jgi:hypothetical protein
MAEIQVTVSEFLDLMEKDGLPKIKGRFLQYDFGSKAYIGGCAMGQAVWNLSKEKEFDLPDDDNDHLDNFINVIANKYFLAANNFDNYDTDIYDLNDSTDASLPEIAQTVREALVDKLSKIFSFDPEEISLRTRPIDYVDDDNDDGYNW